MTEVSKPLPDWMPSEAEFERLMREKYEPLLSGEEYARLREICGIGRIIDGETVEVTQ